MDESSEQLAVYRNYFDDLFVGRNTSVRRSGGILGLVAIPCKVWQLTSMLTMRISSSNL
jgi:hypothetical protein